MDLYRARAPVVKKKEPERRGHGERERAYNGSLGQSPQRGLVVGQGGEVAKAPWS